MLEALLKILVTGGAGFTPLFHKVSNESWVETANCSFEAKSGWRLL